MLNSKKWLYQWKHLCAEISNDLIHSCFCYRRCFKNLLLQENMIEHANLWHFFENTRNYIQSCTDFFAGGGKAQKKINRKKCRTVSAWLKITFGKMPFAEGSACDCCVHLMYYRIKLCKTVHVTLINDSHKQHCLIMSILKFKLEFVLYIAAKILGILKKTFPTTCLQRSTQDLK